MSNRLQTFQCHSAVRQLIFACLIALITCGATAARADEFARRNNQGNSLVEEGRLDDALQKYQEADVERPGMPELDYNMANVYHMKGIFDTAAVEYQEALAHQTTPVTPETFYNLGNTLFRMGQYQPAVEAYKQTLIENPDDLEAKFNLELALKRLESDSTQQEQQDQDQEQEPDSTSQDQEQQNSDQDQQDQDSTSQQQNENQEQKPDSSDAQQQPQDPNEEQQGDQQQQPPPEPIGMTKEDAERILDALKDNELDVQKQRAQRIAVPANAKDW